MAPRPWAQCLAFLLALGHRVAGMRSVQDTASWGSQNASVAKGKALPEYVWYLQDQGATPKMLGPWADDRLKIWFHTASGTVFINKAEFNFEHHALGTTRTANPDQFLDVTDDIREKAWFLPVPLTNSGSSCRQGECSPFRHAKCRINDWYDWKMKKAVTNTCWCKDGWMEDRFRIVKGDGKSSCVPLPGLCMLDDHFVDPDKALLPKCESGKQCFTGYECRDLLANEETKKVWVDQIKWAWKKATSMGLGRKI